MSDNVLRLVPRDEMATADELLEKMAGKFEHVMVIGYTSEGDLSAAVTSYFVDGGSILWALRGFEQAILNGEHNANFHD
ncbi:MAG: hypothetical protein AAFQ05_02830 [Pseudomonadota bacterium]